MPARNRPRHRRGIELREDGERHGDRDAVVVFAGLEAIRERQSDAADRELIGITIGCEGVALVEEEVGERELEDSGETFARHCSKVLPLNTSSGMRSSKNVYSSCSSANMSLRRARSRRCCAFASMRRLCSMNGAFVVFRAHEGVRDEQLASVRLVVAARMRPSGS